MQLHLGTIKSWTGPCNTVTPISLSTRFPHTLILIVILFKLHPEINSMGKSTRQEDLPNSKRACSAIRSTFTCDWWITHILHSPRVDLHHKYTLLKQTFISSVHRYIIFFKSRTYLSYSYPIRELKKLIFIVAFVYKRTQEPLFVLQQILRGIEFHKSPRIQYHLWEIKTQDSLRRKKTNPLTILS